MSFQKLIKELKTIKPVVDNPAGFIHNYMARKPYNVVNLIIKELTTSSDVVCDPMFGSGTTIIESSKLNRSVVGVVPLAHAEYVKVHPSLAEGLGLQDAENDRLYSAGTPALRIEQHPFASHAPLQPRRTVVKCPTSNSKGLRELRT